MPKRVRRSCSRMRAVSVISAVVIRPARPQRHMDGRRHDAKILVRQHHHRPLRRAAARRRARRGIGVAGIGEARAVEARLVDRRRDETAARAVEHGLDRALDRRRSPLAPPAGSARPDGPRHCPSTSTTGRADGKRSSPLRPAPRRSISIARPRRSRARTKEIRGAVDHERRQPERLALGDRA